MTLYHGTTHDFNEIDVRRGKSFKDFGQGFYATATLGHAERLALRNRHIEEERLFMLGDKTRLKAYVYSYEIDMAELNMLNVKYFDSADREWLKFIVLNRTRSKRQHNYDAVIGPTANDDTRTSIRTVLNASNGAILTDTAIDLLIELLEPNNLPTQYYFGTDTAAKLLKSKGRSELR